MVKLAEEPHAPSVSDRPTGDNRSKACFSVFACVVGLQVFNVPVTGLQDYRRPGPPKLSIKSSHVERGTLVPPPSGQANRKASCWRSRSRSFRKRRPCCNGGDTGCDIPGPVRRLTFGWCLVTRPQIESVQWRKANDGFRADAPPGFGYADCLLVS